VVPSAGMKSILLRCYLQTPPDRIEVLPWGAPPQSLTAGSNPERGLEQQDATLGAGTAALRAEYGVEADAHVLLCLSRISPEKGHDFVLKTLLEWEATASFPSRPVWLFICGEPAFMNGERYGRRLRTLAARLKRVRVVFPGYVSGAWKRAFFGLADVFLFASSHESYGLTLMEALGSGLPAISRDHAGARQILSPEFGVIVPGSGRSARLRFRHALESMLSDESLRAAMSHSATRWANERPFCESANRLATILAGASVP